MNTFEKGGEGISTDGTDEMQGHTVTQHGVIVGDVLGLNCSISHTNGMSSGQPLIVTFRDHHYPGMVAKPEQGFGMRGPRRSFPDLCLHGLICMRERTPVRKKFHAY